MPISDNLQEQTPYCSSAREAMKSAKERPAIDVEQTVHFKSEGIGRKAPLAH